jgi:5,10-methylenetetrahydromethanopterin reductase
MPRLGICFTGQPYSLPQVIESARRAEQLGFDSVWLAEDSWTGRDAVTAITAVALNTTGIRIGTCLVGVGTRHPVLTAMTFNSLRDVAEGRLIAGIGLAHGWQPLFDDGPGWGSKSSLTTMRESVAGLRSLLAGGEAKWGGGTRRMMVDRPWFEGAALPSGRGVPIYVGAVGPKMTALAGEIADGLLLEMEALRELLPARLELFRAAAASSGRDQSKLETVKLILTSVGPDVRSREGPRAHHNALGWAAKSVAMLSDDVVHQLGWDAARVARVRGHWASGEWEAGKSAMTPDMARAFVAAGPPDHVLEVVRDTVRTGVSLPVLIPYGGDLRPVLDAGARYIGGWD